MGYSPWGHKESDMTDRPLTPGGSYGKESTCNAGDMGSTPGSGRSFRGGNGNPHQYSYLENPTDRGAWWATVHRISKESDRTEQFTCTHTHTYIHSLYAWGSYNIVSQLYFNFFKRSETEKLV